MNTKQMDWLKERIVDRINEIQDLPLGDLESTSDRNDWILSEVELGLTILRKLEEDYYNDN